MKSRELYKEHKWNFKHTLNFNIRRVTQVLTLQVAIWIGFSYTKILTYYYSTLVQLQGKFSK